MGEGDTEPTNGGWSKASGWVIKTLIVVGGALFVRRLTKSTTRRDHARFVSHSLSGEKNSREQAARDPDHFFQFENDCLSSCRYGGWLKSSVLRAGILENSSETLSPGLQCEQTEHLSVFVMWYFLSLLSSFALLHTLSLRFYMVKPCPKEMKCDVELSTYAIRDMEEYKNFCDRSKDQRPLPEEVIRVKLAYLYPIKQPTYPDILSYTFMAWLLIPVAILQDVAEHLTTIHLKRCERGKRCLYEGKTPSEGFPNTWNNASYCKSELSVLKNNEIHMWDRGYDEDGNQVWGVKEGPYEFKPASTSSFKDMYSPANLLSPLSLDKRIEGSFVLQE
uniref:Uncharacterized protein n=1 Tax=Chenopodium quinoa TaxID=63459 RepID=A0A803NCN9_CHEQI